VHDAVQITGRVALVPTAARIGRLPRQARARQRERIGDIGAVDAPQEDRMPRCGGVERATIDRHRRWPRASKRVGLPGRGGAKVTATDPEALGHTLGDRGDGIGDLARIAKLVQRGAEGPRRGVSKVGVRVDEAGQEEPAGDIDDLGV